MNARSQVLPAAIAIAFTLAVMRWRPGFAAAGAFAAGALGLRVFFSRLALARERPKLTAALGWISLPVVVALVVAATGAGDWEVVSIAGLAFACAPLAAAVASGPSRARSGDLGRAVVFSAPALWALASLARPGSPWAVGLAVVPFGIALAGALRGMSVAERLRAARLGVLRRRALDLSRGQTGETFLLRESSEPGAEALLDELCRWRESLVRAQAESERTGPRLLRASVELEQALAVDQRGAGAWTDALGAFRAGAKDLQRSAEQISRCLGEMSRITVSADLAASQDERGAAAFFSSMEELTQHSLQVADAVRALNVHMQQVGTIVDAITGIADRADLLAVNAELESNRAGEVERAFALLAAEMRRMSEQVIGSVQTISAEIDRVVLVSTAAASAANAAVVATHESTRQGRELTERLVDLLERSRLTAQAVADIDAVVWAQRQASFRLEACGQLLTRVSHEATEAVSRLETSAAEIRTLGTPLARGGGA